MPPLDVALHEQPAAIDTVTAAVPPFPSNVWVAGASVAVQDGVGSVGALLPQATAMLPMRVRTNHALIRMSSLVPRQSNCAASAKCPERANSPET